VEGNGDGQNMVRSDRRQFTLHEG